MLSSSASAPALASKIVAVAAGMRRAGVVLLALIWALIVATAAGAQEEPTPPDAEPALSVLVVNTERILRESEAGRSIGDQADALRTALRSELDIRLATLRAEERELAELREELERDLFDERAAAFEEKVRALRRDQQDDGARLQRALSAAHGALKEQLSPIMFAIMAERRAVVVIEAKDAPFYATSVDVTAEAIKRLDAAVSRIEVRLPIVEDPLTGDP